MKHFYKNLPIVKFIGVLMLLLASISRLEAASFWTDANNYDISWYSPEADEYSISTPQQLAGVAYLVNHDFIDFSDKTLSLTEDIDLSGHLWIPIGNGRGRNANSDGEWHPIAEFRGHFNGNDHVIYGLDIDCSTLELNNYTSIAIGLLVNIEIVTEGKYAEISNLKIIGATISMNDLLPQKYLQVHIGTLAGIAYADIHDIEVESKIEFLPSNLFTQISAGGVTGYGNVTNCTFDGSISIKSDSDSFLGGISGFGNATNCVNLGSINMYGVFATVGGIVGKGGADACINKGNIFVKGEGSESLGYGFSSEIGGIAGYGTVINSGNYGNIDSELYAPLIGSNTVHLGALTGCGYHNGIINSYNFGTIFSKTHNAGLEIVDYLTEYFGDDDKFLTNSYSFVPGNGVYCEVSNKTEQVSESYLKSEEFLELLNKNALSISKSTLDIVQNWVTGENGFPTLSGNNLYPLRISGDYPSNAENEYGSTIIKGTWEDPNISVGEIKINGECFHKGDKVDVTVIPSEGFIFDEAILSYYEFPDTHYISFKSEDLDNNSFSFEMLPHICDLQFRFSSDSGVTDIEIDTDEPVSIYSTDGNLLHKGLIKDAKLNKGIYIVKTHNSTQKILIR